MVKDKKKKEEEKPKKSGLQAFLKKRAPFYLAAVALIVISIPKCIIREESLRTVCQNFQEKSKL